MHLGQLLGFIPELITNIGYTDKKIFDPIDSFLRRKIPRKGNSGLETS